MVLKKLVRLWRQILSARVEFTFWATTLSERTLQFSSDWYLASIRCCAGALDQLVNWLRSPIWASNNE